MHTLTGHICNILNASAKDCSISRNQQHMCNNPSLLGSIRLYWIGTGTTVQYSGKLECQKSSYSLNTRGMKQQEKYSLVTTLGHPFTKRKHSFSQLIFCFSYSFATSTQLVASVIPLHLWNKKIIHQSLLEPLCLLVSTITSSITHLSSIISIHIEYMS